MELNGRQASWLTLPVPRLPPCNTAHLAKFPRLQAASARCCARGVVLRAAVGYKNKSSSQWALCPRLPPCKSAVFFLCPCHRAPVACPALVNVGNYEDPKMWADDRPPPKTRPLAGRLTRWARVAHRVWYSYLRVVPYVPQTRPFL